jgi:Sulfotransferase family
MGAGRSGSTILGVSLGNCEGVFYAGELDKWLIRSGQPALGGREREQFWERVRAQVHASDLYGYQTRVLERSSALFSLRKARQRRRLRRRYQEVAGELYRAIAAEARSTHVVDSSHYPLRARELQRLEAIELYLVFLVRDSQQVVKSLGRRGVPERRFNLPTANAYLWLTHALSVAVFLRHPRERRVLLRYEDFVQDPTAAIGSVLQRTGARAQPPDFGSLRTGMPIQGNRLLEASQVSLQHVTPAAPARSRLTGVLQLPWRIVLARLAPRVASGPSR